MTRVLVTGMTSTHCNPERAKHDVTVASLLVSAMRESGWDVEHRNPDFTEPLDAFDHVFCGITAPHAVGANRIYGALGVILRGMADKKITLFIDDADVPKIGGGLRTMVNNPERFTKQFYQYRPGWELASEEPWRSWLYSGITILNENAWPTTILPLFPWADLTPWRRKLPNATELVPLDLTAYLPNYTVDSPDDGRERLWVSEVPNDSRWYRTVRPVLDVERYGSPKHGHKKRLDDSALVARLSATWGVIDEPTPDGWWTSRLGYAAMARSLYITKWQAVQALGEAYGVLPDSAASWDVETRDAWADAQGKALRYTAPFKNAIETALSALIASPEPKLEVKKTRKRKEAVT